MKPHCVIFSAALATLSSAARLTLRDTSKTQPATADPDYEARLNSLLASADIQLDAETNCSYALTDALDAETGAHYSIAVNKDCAILLIFAEMPLDSYNDRVAKVG